MVQHTKHEFQHYNLKNYQQVYQNELYLKFYCFLHIHIGKTYILKEFGEEQYENIAYFNFDHDEALKELFVSTKDQKRILEQLVFATGKAIKPEKTLIIFDEVQECPNALNSLIYFQEEVNEYHIVCAGSLLGIKLSHTSFPVGKVEYLEMYPMTFTEFLLADNQENLVQYMESITKIEKIPDIIFNQLNEKIKSYFIKGNPLGYFYHSAFEPLKKTYFYFFVYLFKIIFRLCLYSSLKISFIQSVSHYRLTHNTNTK